MWYYKYGMKTKEFNLQFQKTKNRWVARRNPSSRSGWGVEYYPAEGKALSYGWWQFLARIDGQLVINMGSYSRTTTKHQQEVLWKLINDKVNYISINIGDSSLTSIHDVAKSLMDGKDVDLTKYKPVRQESQKTDAAAKAFEQTGFDIEYQEELKKYLDRKQNMEENMPKAYYDRRER